MDKTVPKSAGHILDFIAETETGKAGYDGYNVLYAHKKWPTPITKMTVDEWIAAGPTWTKKHGSSAAGRYQFMRATLQDLKKELGLGGKQVMDPNLQDRLGYHLLRRRGYDRWAQGGSDETFMIGLAKEWASFPVPYAMKGAHRTLQAGQSYYAGDGMNKALVAVSTVKAVLNEAKLKGHGAPEPAPEPAEVVQNTDPVVDESGGLIAALLKFLADWAAGKRA